MGPFSRDETITLFYNVLKSVNNERFSSYGFSDPEGRMNAIQGDYKAWLQDLKRYTYVSNSQEFSRTPKHHYHGIKIDASHLAVGLASFSGELSQAGDDIVFELPHAGYPVEAGCYFGRVESITAASNLNSPIGGTVVKFNTELLNNPGLIYDNTFHDGWLVVIKSNYVKELDGLPEFFQA